MWDFRCITVRGRIVKIIRSTEGFVWLYDDFSSSHFPSAWLAALNARGTIRSWDERLDYAVW